MSARTEIEGMMKALIGLEGLLPGHLHATYNVCGKKGCRCKDPENPQKHGPYNKVSYQYKGKGTTLFVSTQYVDQAALLRENYDKFKEISLKLPYYHMRLIKEEGWEAELPTFREVMKGELTTNSLATVNKLKERIEAYKRIAQAKSVKIRDLTASRNDWKSKYAAAKDEIKTLQKELHHAQQQINDLGKKKQFPQN